MARNLPKMNPNNSRLSLSLHDGNRGDQSFLVGDSIKVTAIECRKGQVRLLIEAPRDVEILRESLFKAKQERSSQQKTA